MSDSKSIAQDQPAVEPTAFPEYYVAPDGDGDITLWRTDPDRPDHPRHVLARWEVGADASSDDVWDALTGRYEQRDADGNIIRPAAPTVADVIVGLQVAVRLARPLPAGGRLAIDPAFFLQAVGVDPLTAATAAGIDGTLDALDAVLRAAR